jgi:hypothetical protein
MVRLQEYYREIREVEAQLDGEEVQLVSLKTSDGGRPGRLITAPREIAARLIVEQRARVATVEEVAAAAEDEARRAEIQRREWQAERRGWWPRRDVARQRSEG